MPLLNSSEQESLLPNPATARTYGVVPQIVDEENQSLSPKFKKMQARLSTMSAKEDAPQSKFQYELKRFPLYIVYALVNVIISAPGLYGYAAVIFNNPVFNQHMNALSKLVIFSSLVHQLGFTLFSTLNFAIGTVQDAGLIFLSAMSNKIADSMLEDGHSVDEIVATTVVLLSCGTALLGVCLMVVGKCGLADAVSYLPMPVVGGYLAYIGYFCVQAGVALCISTPLVSTADWVNLLDPHKLLLAVPGLAAGLVLTLASRKISNDAALPLIMVSIPACFYLFLWMKGESLETARESGWVGQVAPPVPVTDLFGLFNFSLVKWSLWTKIFSTWIGMVFVVAFASCLDVAAIAIDMGEALDTNHELATVGICNLMSGLTMGYTGSYIFSQTIFTYRTGIHSRFIGILIMCVFFYIVMSKVNILQVAPLFFLGSTLIFIGYDLLFEWLWEIRHQVFLSEYGIVILTFIAIQVVGIDAGIIIGVLVAIVDHVVLTATTSTITQVHKRSRAIWTPDENKILHNYAYNIANGPKIVTLELTGTIFFGSALQCLNRIIDEANIKKDDNDEILSPGAIKSPRTPHGPSLSSMQRDRKSIIASATAAQTPIKPAGRPPKYLVLDLLYVTHLDASATRGCFLQLVKICAKQGIVVCASGVTPRIEWMFRTHGVAYKSDEESSELMARRLSAASSKAKPTKFENALLFVSVQDALEFCENAMIHEYKVKRQLPQLANLVGPEKQSIQSVLAGILNASPEDREILNRLEGERYHIERDFKNGQVIFELNTHADSFFVVLQGSVANNSGTARAVSRLKQPVISGAGKIGSRTDLMESIYLEPGKEGAGNVAAMIWSVGSAVGFLDFILERPRLFRLVACKEGTRVAQVTSSHLNLLKSEDPELYTLMQGVLLRACTSDLANCTCNYE